MVKLVSFQAYNNDSKFADKQVQYSSQIGSRVILKKKKRLFAATQSQYHIIIQNGEK